MTKAQVIALLKENQDERGIAHWKKRYATNGLRSYGVGLSKLRKLAKQIGRDHRLAATLWKSDVYEAKILGLLIDDPKQLTREQVEQQVDSGANIPMFTHVFSCCDATLPKAPIAFEIACDWMDSKDPIRQQCAYGMIYEFSKIKSKKAPDESFFLDCLDRIERTIHDQEMWVRESMKGAMFGIGKRSKTLNKAAIKAVKAIGPVDVDYGDDNDCEPLDVLKHLTSDYIKKKFA